MLKELHIQNFALIESLDLNFSNGFSVFTGETGSGKSIILGALNLILGERADYGVIRYANKKTIVEAVFSIQKLTLEDFFTENDLDYAEEVFIRREIASNGKSRAFINDTPVSLNVLNELTSQLIKIHSQYHTYALKSKKFQMDLIDGLAGVQLTEYQRDFKRWKQTLTEINQLENQISQAVKEADYVRFQIEELQSLNLEQVDYEVFEKQLTQLENATEIIQQLNNITQVLDSESGVLPLLRGLNSSLLKVGNLHPKLNEQQERIQSVIAELKDINEDASDTVDTIAIDEEKQYEIAQLLDNYNRQIKKHQVANQEELKKVLHQFLSENSSSEKMEERLKQIKEECEQLFLKLSKQAQEIHTTRLNAKADIEKNIATLLMQLKLADARVVVELTTTEDLREDGCSEIALLFTSNKGSELKPIEKAASGGELSRLMLSIERLLSESRNLPTLILDEIDTGVSGEVALKIGQMLGEMGENMQLFAITHLPQVAARGQQHFKVHKKEVDNVTNTYVLPLDKEERLLEIAGLMSGENISAAAIENAKILMQ